MKKINIIHKDPEFLVVNKPGGLLSVPGRGPEKQDCVVNRIRTLYPGTIKQPAVHRLDMYTSGIMLIARTKRMHRLLSIQFEQRKVQKKYIAILDGVVRGTEGIIKLTFRLDPDNRPHQVYDPEQGKTGITRWKNIGTKHNQTRILFFPLTGRTHQLRLHSAHPLGLGIPIVGDALYGYGEEGDQMFLHASGLSFFHPNTGDHMEFISKPDF
jgi:tRNA pseudouridine32 synthase/23S rRNA pseudouridine746 synthase